MINYNRIGLINVAGSTLLSILSLSVQTRWGTLVKTTNLFMIFPILASIIAYYLALRLRSSLNKPFSEIGGSLLLQIIFSFIGLFLPHVFGKLSLGAGLWILLPIPGYLIVFLSMPKLIGTARLKAMTGIFAGIAWICLSEYLFGESIHGYLPVVLLNIFGGLLFIGYYSLFILVMILSNL